MTLWMQPTTGMVHRSQTCSVARRSRYGLVPAHAGAVVQGWCKRCFPAGPLVYPLTEGTK